MNGEAEPAKAIAAPLLHISDKVLVEFIADGDKAALRLLYLRYCRLVYRFAVRLTGSVSAAEETVNEVFLAVWRDARRFKGRSQVATWLLGIARFKALSQRRRRLELPRKGHAPGYVKDISDSSAASMENHQRRDILQKCVAVVSAIHRDIGWWRTKHCNAANTE
jgi:RNA polymerase sigma-70 factor (ECF subfamily)